MKTLVVISRAHADTAFRLAEELHDADDEIAFVFTGRGTHHLSNEETLEKLSYGELYTLEDEYDSTDERVHAISYESFIVLLEESERTFSWI
ncbi:MAG: DsrE family protein [Candidatus Bathyarchaeota archaeon]|nr:DsrE family protein [Candidatus Bathyarchaeota archaeon]